MAVRQLKRYVSWVQNVARQLKMTWLSINLAICWNVRSLAVKRRDVVSDATRLASKNVFSADNQQGRLNDAGN